MKKTKIKVWKSIPKNFEFKHFTNELARINDYIVVYFCNDYEELKKKVHYIEGVYPDIDTLGRSIIRYRIYYNDEANYYSKYKGVIYLIVKDLSFEIIAHEVSHIVSGYFLAFINEYSRGISDINNREVDYYEDYNELFAYIVGSLCDQIIRAYYKYYENDTEEENDNQ